MKYKKSKELVEKIAKQESKKTGITITAEPLTKLENILYILKNEVKYLTTHDFNKNIDFFKMNFFDRIHGYYDDERNILKILLSSIKKDKVYSPDNVYYLTNLIIITYHELYHKISDETLKQQPHLDLNKFIYLVENDQAIFSTLYSKYVEQFYAEITAQLYSFQQAKIVLKKHPDIYPKVEAYLEATELYYKVLYVNYDVETLLNKYPSDTILLLGNKQLDQSLILDNIWSSTKLEIKYTLLSTKRFLSGLDYKNLTLEELQILSKALTFSLENMTNKEDTNEQLQIEIKQLQKRFSQFSHLLSTIDDVLLKKTRRNRAKVNYLELQIYHITQEINSRSINSKPKTRQLINNKNSQ